MGGEEVLGFPSRLVIKEFADLGAGQGAGAVGLGGEPFEYGAGQIGAGGLKAPQEGLWGVQGQRHSRDLGRGQELGNAPDIVLVGNRGRRFFAVSCQWVITQPQRRSPRFPGPPGAGSAARA